MNIGITGSNGFLGTSLTTTCRTKGHTVQAVRLPRNSDIMNSVFLRHLLSRLNLDALIHTAISRHPTNALENYLNTNVPLKLEETFRQINKEAIFMHVSSLNVIVNGLNDQYTKAKRKTEKVLSASSAIIVRPSLIWSSQGEGDAGRLERFIKSNPIVPIPFPGNIHLPVLSDTLSETMLELLCQKNKKKTFNILGDKTFSVWELAKTFSTKYNKFLVPIPTLRRPLFLPKPFRSINYTVFNYAEFKKPCREFHLPFFLT